jgi:hypothetical protein
MLRLVQPERLDTLHPSDPDALASRRDLVTINRLMGNYRWFERIIHKQLPHPSHCLEIGAGGGELAKFLIQQSNCRCYTAVELAPRPQAWPESAVWHQGDLLDYTGYDSAEILIANLVLHHFTDAQLARLGAILQRGAIRHILANEPCRRSLHKIQLRAGRLIGFNPVTLYDGVVSIDGGFRNSELPRALGLDPQQWSWTIRETALGAYRMEAKRQ